jgi:hypothetical protein
MRLTFPEKTILDSVPEHQLLSLIEHTIVSVEHRHVFLGKVAALMLMAIGAATTAPNAEAQQQNRNNPPQEQISGGQAVLTDVSNALLAGTRPDDNDVGSLGIRSDNSCEGIRPERTYDLSGVKETLRVFLDKSGIGLDILEGMLEVAHNKFLQSNKTEDFPEIANIFASLQKSHDALLKKIAEDTGKSIEINFDGDVQTFTLLGIDSGKIKIGKKEDKIGVELSLSTNTLPVAEINARLRGQNPEDAALYLAVVSWQQGKKNKAKEYLRKGGGLAAPLLAMLVKEKNIRPPKDLDLYGSFGIE